MKKVSNALLQAFVVWLFFSFYKNYPPNIINVMIFILVSHLGSNWNRTGPHCTFLKFNLEWKYFLWKQIVRSGSSALISAGTDSSISAYCPGTEPLVLPSQTRFSHWSMRLLVCHCHLCGSPWQSPFCLPGVSTLHVCDKDACCVPEFPHSGFLSCYLKAVKTQYTGPSAEKGKCQKLHDKTHLTNGLLQVTKGKVVLVKTYRVCLLIWLLTDIYKIIKKNYQWWLEHA